MRDIVYRPVLDANAAEPDHRRTIHSKIAAARHLELFKPDSVPEPSSNLASKILEGANQLLGKISARLNPELHDQKVLTPAAKDWEPHQQYGKRSSQTKLKDRARRASKLALAKSKDHARKLHGHLKTPVGRLAMINGFALVALFAFVLSQTNLTINSNSDNSSQDSLAVTQPIRRYLPAIPAASSIPLNESKINQDGHRTKLHTWVTPWNATLLKENSAVYGSISAFWGTVEENGSGISLKGSLQIWKDFEAVLPPSIPTYLTISGDPNFTYLTLSSESTQHAFISNLLTLLKDNNFTGVDIDFEALGSSNRDLFTSFIRNLSAALKPEGKEVHVTVEARIANNVPMDWRALGQIADEVRIMAYDYHSRQTGEPGPIAPLGWVKEVVDYAVTVIPIHKVVIGLGNYGYDWTAPTAPETSWNGLGLSQERAISLAQQYNTPVVRMTGLDSRGYDIGNIPSFTYLDESQTQHSVWFEDADSLNQKLDLLDQYSIGGVIFWSVGLGDQDFWTNQ